MAAARSQRKRYLLGRSRCRQLLAGYPSTSGASALAAWMIALKALGLND
jgi:hypothetical protein